ncbi:hypothetical protein ACWKW6_18450 [Dyadobacter jiangsuensis]|uniref:hypothetical protein n=1 Tax=Dyadobacter fermentans TaxID=94254 RepID=UPI001CBC925D|nr:hypothetical protein [Dyadobacter fermentans]MBZ1362965.1 hypothetical protein [Dyadobacter fermentans]
MKNEQSQTLEEPAQNVFSPLPDLSEDPFLLRKEKAAIEFLMKNPIPRHLLPKKKKQAAGPSKR